MYTANSRSKFVAALLGLSLVLFAPGMTALAQTQSPAAPEPKPKVPTVFVVGDSTANNNANGARGWGDPFVSYFDAAQVNVLNRARGGRSSRTFVSEGLWEKVLHELKPGDFVLLQFGHNDGGPLNTDRARGSLPGIGEESQEVVMPGGSKEVVRTFGWYLRKMVNEAKAKGSTPIVLSLTVRNIWQEGKVERGAGKFGQWAAEIARSTSVEFLDLTTIIADQYDKLGEASVKELFATDHTHTSPKGAELNAASVVAGLKGLGAAPLNKFFSEKGIAVAGPGPNRTAGLRRPLPEPANPKLPTLFLIGDSTVRNGQGDGGGGQWGWGEPLSAYFDTTKINVVNRAVGGLSSRTYLSQGHWDRVLLMLRPGDVVIMQFGHNDNGPLNDNSRARGTIKGIGEETEEIDNILTKKHEVVHTYGWYLRRFVADARAKGATPIICSLIPRKIWKDNHIVRNSEDYGKWAAAVAAAERTGFIDLNEIIALRYDELGPEKVEPLFGDPHTHTSLAGAELNAECVVAGLKALKKDPLELYFSAKAKAVAKVRIVH